MKKAVKKTSTKKKVVKSSKIENNDKDLELFLSGLRQLGEESDASNRKLLEKSLQTIFLNMEDIDV